MSGTKKTKYRSPSCRSLCYTPWRTDGSGTGHTERCGTSGRLGNRWWRCICWGAFRCGGSSAWCCSFPTKMFVERTHVQPPRISLCLPSDPRVFKIYYRVLSQNGYYFVVLRISVIWRSHYQNKRGNLCPFNQGTNCPSKRRNHFYPTIYVLNWYRYCCRKLTGRTSHTSYFAVTDN